MTLASFFQMLHRQLSIVPPLLRAYSECAALNRAVFLATLTAALQVFPLEVVRRRMQTIAADSLAQKAGVMVIRQAVMDIWAKERLKGFYVGMLPNTIQVCVLPLVWSAALHTACWQRASTETLQFEVC